MKKLDVIPEYCYKRCWQQMDNQMRYSEVSLSIQTEVFKWALSDSNFTTTAA